jgi:hypothetical protein
VAEFLGTEDAIAYGMGFATNSASLPVLCGEAAAGGRAAAKTGGRSRCGMPPAAQPCLPSRATARPLRPRPPQAPARSC